MVSLYEIRKEFCDLISSAHMHRHTDRLMNGATFLHSKRHQFYIIFVHFGRYTMKLLRTKSTVHTGSISSDVEGAWTERPVNVS